MSAGSFRDTIQGVQFIGEVLFFEKCSLPEGGDMKRLLRLVERGKALTHMITGKREALPGERVVLEARANINDLGWYLADNIAGISVRRSKKARSLPSRVPR